MSCALRRVEHYEPVSFPLEPPDAELVDALPDVLAAELARGRLRSVADLDGREGLDALAALTDEARYGLYATSVGWARGAELDLLVDTGRGPVPVTLWWSPRGDAVVASSDAVPTRALRPEEVELDAWAARVASEHGTGGFAGDLPWSDVELGDVALALALLTPEERAALAGVVIERVPASPRRASRELAYFDPTFEPPRLQFYDIAFGDDHLGFVGPHDAPIASGAMTALHEFGHVLADAPLRRAFVAYLDAWEVAGDARSGEARAVERAAWRTYKDLGRDGPVIEAWEVFRAGRRGPSSFGFASRHESFAEAFALAHVDPDALERALPGAVAWFASGAHVEAAR